LLRKKPRALREFGIQKRKEVIPSMKKLLSLVLCLIIALAFAAGCKKKEAAPAQAPMTSAAAPAAPAAPEAAPAEKK
jgi:hypothetical protein